MWQNNLANNQQIWIRKKVLEPLFEFYSIYKKYLNCINISPEYQIYSFETLSIICSLIKWLREDFNEKKRFLSGIALMREGGSNHARIFWPFFKKCIFGQ